jgi:hypothetical protein
MWGGARWCYRKWYHRKPRDRKWHDRKWRQSHDRKWSHAHAQPVPALFSYYSSTKCTIAHDRHGYRMWRTEGFPWKGGMRIRKLRKICSSGAFSPEVASSNVTWFRSDSLGRVGARMRNRKLRNIRSNVTRRASHGKYGSAHARSEVPLGYDLICSQTQSKRGLKCFISPTNHITGNWTNQITRNEPTRSLIPKMNNQLQPS